MNIQNWWIFTGLVMVALQALALIFYVVPKQYSEVVGNVHKRYLPHQVVLIGYLIFAAELLFLISLPLGLPRSIQLISLPAPNTVSKMASISTRIPGFASMIVLVLIYYIGSKPLDD